MAKAKKIEYGIEITRPWSKAMYAHNDAVMEVAKEELLKEWHLAYDTALVAWEDADPFTEEDDIPFRDAEWQGAASDFMIMVQRAVTLYSFGDGYTIGRVSEKVVREIINAPYYRLKEMTEELDIRLDPGFVGLK